MLENWCASWFPVLTDHQPLSIGPWASIQGKESKREQSKFQILRHREKGLHVGIFLQLAVSRLVAKEGSALQGETKKALLLGRAECATLSAAYQWISTYLFSLDTVLLQLYANWLWSLFLKCWSVPTLCLDIKYKAKYNCFVNRAFIKLLGFIFPLEDSENDSSTWHN